MTWKNVKDSCFLVSWGSSGGRKSGVASGKDGNRQIFFFRNPRKPSHVEFCSESFFIEIPQLSIITELSMPITFFIFVLSWRQTTQKTSKNERGRRAVTACYLLETDVSLFFWPKSYTFNYLRRKNFEVRSFKNLWMLWISLPSIFIWSYLIHTWKVSREISLRSVLVLLASFEADWQQVFTSQRSLIFFAASKKPYGSWRFYTDLDWVKWMDRVVG